MAEVLGSGSNPNNRGLVSRLSTQSFSFALIAAILACSVFSAAQVTPARPAKKESPPPAAVKVSVAPEVANPAPSAQSAPALLLMVPGRPPLVEWDGKLLTIDAENSTLSDVLLAIRSRTGASIEMPGSASAERIALHVGPAPIRDVLSSLLYGTNFNYVIQASEDDESGLGKVILISRDGSGDDEPIGGGDVRADRSVRLMPGYAAPGKRDFEVAHTRAMREAADNGSTADSSSQDATPAPENDTASNSAPEAESQPVAANTDSSNATAAQPDTTLTAEQPITSPAASIASAGSGASTNGEGPSISNMESSLQKMYEQRRQIQAQQKQPQQTPPAP